jgi:hypothetical protein
MGRNRPRLGEGPMTPLDDFPPTVRASVLRLRRLNLDTETLEAVAEVLAAVLLAKLIVAVEERVKEAVAKRDRQWKARLEHPST